jgi:hypothetical protein
MALPENRPHSANLTPEEMRQGIRRLEHRVAEVDTFQSDLTPNQIEQIQRRVQSTLAKVFGALTIEGRRYMLAAGRCWKELTSHNQLLDPMAPLIRYRAGLLTVLREALAFLVEELDVVTDDQPPQTRAERRYGKTLPKPDQGSSIASGNKVFIVHGHDRIAKFKVAHFIQQQHKLEVIILDEQPKKGRTVIESFEDHAGEVGFAVVIMTPDDIVTSPVTRHTSTAECDLRTWLFRGQAREI